MEKKAHYFVVGVFVLATIAALVGFTIWLVRPHDNEASDFYTVYFSDSVSGLQKGTSVTYHGLDVGKVVDLRLEPQQIDVIKVDIAVDKTTPVRGRTRAQLVLQGVTGLVQLDLATDPADTTPLPTVEGEKYPILKGQPSKLSRMVDNFTGLMSESNAAAESVRKLSDDLRADPSQIIFGAKKKPEPEKEERGRRRDQK